MSKYDTQWAGQFYVAYELCRRGYRIALTHGNMPQTDIIATSPKGRSFRIEVKSMRGKNFWRYKRRDAEIDLFYVFVLTNEKINPPRVSVLTSEEVMAEYDTYFKAHPNSHQDNQWGTTDTIIRKYVGQWGKLPE
jgi:hypothetical protein